MDDFARWLRRGDVLVRVERIEKECASPLGWAARGITSWEQDWLEGWRRRPESLTEREYAQLADIERRIFGE